MHICVSTVLKKKGQNIFNFTVVIKLEQYGFTKNI